MMKNMEITSESSCLYKNFITLEKIKKSLCQEKSNKDFVNMIFKPLKDPYQLTFTDSFGEKHLSSFMKGNHDGRKRLNVRKLKLWSEILCEDAVLNEMKKPVEAMAEAYNVDEHHAIYQLIEPERCEMPDSLKIYIDQCIKHSDHGSAIIMMILWSVYGKEQIDLLYPIYERAQCSSNEQHVRLLSRVKPCRPVFKGRDNIIEQIHTHFSSGETFLFLQGMGGIGKSECAKQYSERYRKQYDTVIFAEYSDSIMSLLNDNSVFTLTEPFVSDRIFYSDGKSESDTEFYLRKLTQFRLSACSRTLVILDNLENYDPELESILSGPFHLIITTRWKSQDVYPKNTITINEIQDKNILKEIFSEYYGKNVSDSVYAERLIELFQCHTMALELIARQMKASCLTPEEMLEVMDKHTARKLQEGFLMLNYDNVQLNLVCHIQRLFDISLLTDTEKYIMMCMSLLSVSGMEKYIFRKCCGLKDYNEINNLIERSWICESDGILSVHTLVKETVQIVCRPDLLKCRKFIDGIIQEFTALKCYYINRSQKDMIEKLAMHFYHTFPEPVPGLYDFYEWMELIFSHCCQYKISIDLSGKLWKIYQKEFGSEHFRTARMLCRIGCGEAQLHNRSQSMILLQQSKETIINLKNKTVMEELYISDIDVVLSNFYMEYYKETQNEDMLDIAEELCNEIILIRSRLSSHVSEKLYVNCAIPYRNLAWIEISRNNYDRASWYIHRTEEECSEPGVNFTYYFTDYARAHLEIRKRNYKKAIEHMLYSLNEYEGYFGKFDSRTIKLNIELGEFYEQSGDKCAAHAQYLRTLKIIQDMPYHNEELRSVTEEKLKHLSSDTA